MTRAAFAACLLALLSACAAKPPLRQLLPPGAPVAVELAGTPFFPQEDYECGPAALATVLAATGVEVTPDDLVPQVYLPGREGSLQPELLGATRRHGRLAYTLAPDPAAFLAELVAGRPVLVLQNLRTPGFPVWHYAVLVGYDAAVDGVLLRSGRDARVALGWRRFAATVERAGNWGVVVVEPGELPATVEPGPYLAAAAGLESAGRLQEALAAYDAGLARWPDEALLWLGRGNASHATGRLPDALAAYRRASTLAPQNLAASYNLAAALLESGCAQEALNEVERARELAAGTALEDEVGELRDSARIAGAGPQQPACAAP